MKKKLLLTLISSVAFCLGASAQASAYSFNATAGAFTAITGGTVINTTIPDSYASGSIILSPGFSFAGITYTNAYMTSNGLITLGGTTGPSNTSYNGIANTTGSGIALCPFNADMVGSSATGANPNMRFETVGNEHVFQWQDVSRWTAGTDRMNIQVRLNTITKTITYVYDLVTAGASVNYQPIIGIRTSATDYKNLSVTGAGTETWANPNMGTATTDAVRFTTASPAKIFTSGQTYVWSPPSCMAPASSILTVTALTYSSAIVSWAPGNTETSWIFGYAPPTTTVMLTTPSYTFTNLTPTTGYSVMARAYCGVGDTSAWTSVRTFTTLCVPAIVSSTMGGNICVSGTVNLQATTASSSTINWYTAATGGAATSTNAIFATPTLTNTTTYYVSATGAGCESARIPVVANVNQRPFIIAISSATAICAGSSANLVAGGPSTTFTWFPNGGHLNNASVSPNTTTTYTVAGENAPSCASTATVKVIVNPAPLVSANVLNTTICSGQTTTLSASGSAVNYLWYPDGGINAEAVITPTASTNYVVTGFDALGCTATASLELVVNPTPEVSAAASKTLSCPGEEVVLFASTDATSYVWSNFATTINTTVTPLSSTVYSVNASNGICSASAFVSITIDACTGINKLSSSANGFKLYPQPAGDVVTVLAPAGTKSTLRIYDVVGKMVASQDLSQEMNTVNVNNLQSGVYFYKISDNNTELTAGKIIKQ